MQTKLRGLALALVLIAPGLAAAQSEQNASDASALTSQAAGALAESGVKTAVGVSAAPLAIGGSAALAAGTIASAAGEGALGSADASAAYADAPLSVSDEVIVAPAPDGPPNVPYTPGAAGGQP